MSNEFAPAPYPRLDGTQPCASEDPEVFFFGSSRQMAYSEHRARAACAACPFRRECLAYALTHDVDGFWGGTSENERKRLRRRHGIRAATLYADDQAGYRDALLELDRQGMPAAEIALQLGRSERQVARDLLDARGYLTPEQSSARTSRGAANRKAVS